MITGEQDSAVSKILTSSEATNFDATLPQCTTSDVNVAPNTSNVEPKPASSAASPSTLSGTHQYNNCQVNVYSAPAFSPYDYNFPRPPAATNFWPQTSMRPPHPVFIIHLFITYSIYLSSDSCIYIYPRDTFNCGYLFLRF